MAARMTMRSRVPFSLPTVSSRPTHGRTLVLSFALVLGLVAGCAATQQVRETDASAPAMEGYEPVEDLYVVDCLLPGEVRKMGKMTYLSPRKPIKTTARDCRIRGGEYVAYSRSDYRSALKVWRGRAEEGDAEAQVIVGEIFEKGLGTAPDYASAFSWYRKAARQGNRRGQMNLAYFYEQGLGVEQDMTAALEWYRKASGTEDDQLIFASQAQQKIDALRAQLQSEIEESRAQKRALQRQLRQLRDQLREQQAKLRDQQSQLERERAEERREETKLEQQQAQLERARAEQQESQQTIEALEKLLADANKRVADKQRRLDKLQDVDVGAVSDTRGGGPPDAARMGQLNFGRYFALIVGLERYEHWDDLSSPHEDAERLGSLLADRYGFSTRVILDADARRILSALNDLREEVTEDDSVLIYFAGHGQLREPVEANQHGYWLPVNAHKERTTYWLANSQINEQIALIDARSVMVVADSCYAGAMSSDPASLLLGGSGELSERQIELGLERRARFVLSSGGLHPVLDRGGGKHSIFAKAMIDVLASNRSVIHEQALYREVRRRVVERSKQIGFEQRPELRPIRAAGHSPGGSFFLVPRGEQARTAPPLRWARDGH